MDPTPVLATLAAHNSFRESSSFGDGSSISCFVTEMNLSRLILRWRTAMPI